MSGAGTVVIDLRGLRFMDSTGLHFVLGADARARQRGGRLLVVKGPEAVDRLFRLAHLGRRLDLVAHPDDQPADPDDESRERETTSA